MTRQQDYTFAKDRPQVELGKFRYVQKLEVTGTFELPQWWRLPERVRWEHTARNYQKSYDAWTAEFTFATRKYSGQWLVDYINNKDPEALVLDVGCGSNPYKGKIKNLIGIEPGDWGSADLRWSLGEAGNMMCNNTFDYIVAIGPLNHGDTYEIDDMLGTIHGLLKPGGELIALVKPANWAHIKVDPWRENRGLCYPWLKKSIQKFESMHGFSSSKRAVMFGVDGPVLDGTDLGTISTEKLEYLSSIEPWEKTLYGAPPVEQEVQDGDMYSQWQAVQRELERRQNRPNDPSEVIRQRWFWIWQKDMPVNNGKEDDD